METIIARKYAIIEKVMHLGENELTELETVIERFSSKSAISIEQYNQELEEAEAEIGRGDYYTHEQAIERLSRWKKKKEG